MSVSATGARAHRAALALGGVALAVLCALAVMRDSMARTSGDEATYLAMAESLARDFDLAFTLEDEERLLSSPDGGSRAVILQRTERGVSYSKPFLSAVVMAPLYAIAGELGPVAANALLLVAALALLWLYLRRFSTRGAAALTLVTFAMTGVLLPYVAWKTSDILQATLALAGLVLCIGHLRVRGGEAREGLLDRPGSVWLGAFLLGLLIAVRPPNALVAGIAPLALLLEGRPRDLNRFVGGSLVALLLAAAASWAFYGTVMPYKAERASFNLETGFPAGDDAVEVADRFEVARATSSLDASPELEPRVSAFASIYFLIGRHTGVLVYFPAALFLVATALRRPDRVTLAVLVGVAAVAAFFLLWLPFNYFGGGSCVGNRYFLVGYAALPLALRQPLGRIGVTASWLIALLVAGSAVASERRVDVLDSLSQGHAYAGVFRFLPYESTASDLEGSRDRYFGKDFVRSVDPFVEARAWSFTLESGRPAAEWVLANLEREAPIRLLVHSSSPTFELTYEDFGQRRVFPLSRPMGHRGLIEIEPTPPVRHHPLWFRNPWDHGKPYWVRLFRLGLTSSDDESVQAEVRFLGSEPFPPPIFERTVLAADLPQSVRAGSSSTVPVRVRNDNRQAWRSDRLFPVYLSYRIERLEDGGSHEGPRTRLPRVVRPSDELTAEVDVQWPAEAGRYKVRLDMVAEGIWWFERRAGAPLAQAIVEVVGDAVEPSGAEQGG